MSQYNGDLLWEDWSNAANRNANTLIRDILEAYQWYQKWYGLTYGMTIAQIQALPQFANKTVTDIQNMMYAFGVFNDLYGALFNVAALPQANREAYLVPFVS